MGGCYSAVPPAGIVLLSVNLGRKDFKARRTEATKRNDKRFCKPLQQASASQHPDLFFLIVAVQMLSPLFCHLLLSLPGGGGFVSCSAPMYICCRDRQQQGQQMSTAIAPPPRPSPRPTQWDRLSMQHTLTQKGLYSWAECRFPHHMPHLHWNVIIFTRRKEE